MGNSDVQRLSDQLRQQSAWMARLVGRLVRDGSGVEDVVQEAQLAALRRERTGEPVSRGWLARVALNSARKQRRDDASRRAIERDAARAEAVPPADELVARLDAQRALGEELSALSEPYRSTLVRHFFDGWSAARIARTHGLPPTTVRTRLERGLQLLRERLDRRSGGRRTWCVALAPLAAPRVPPWLDIPALPLARVIQGALLMKGVLQATAAVALVTALGLGLWWQGGRPEAVEPAIAAEPRSPVETLRSDAAAPILEPQALARRELGPDPAQSVPEASTPATPDPDARVEARVIDSASRPIAGAGVVLTDGADEVLARAFSRADGSVALAWTPGSGRRRTVLAVSASGFATRFLEARLARGETIRLGDVELGPGAAVAGRIVDPEGRPLADARVLVTAPDPWSADVESVERCGVHVDVGAPGARSFADGTFLVEGVAPGGCRAIAEVPGRRYAVSQVFTVRAGETVDGLVLVSQPLRAEDEIAGIVLAPDGTPAAGASLVVKTTVGGGTSSRSEAVGPDGRFRFRVSRVAPHELLARGGERWEDVLLSGVMPGAREVVLRFAESRFVAVLARGTGAAVPRFALTAFAADDGDKLHATGVVPADQGRVRVRVPARRFELEVAAPGCALARLGPFDPAAPPAELEVELEPEPGLTGTVTAGGVPLAGARVTLWRVGDERMQIEVDGYRSRLDPRVVDDFVSGSDGTFFLRAREAAAHVVRAEAPGWVYGEIGPVQVQPGVAHAGLELALGHGGRIEGRVLVAPGRSAEGVLVVANRGDGRPRTTRTAAGGAFAFERVTPGRCFVGRGRSDVEEGHSQSWSIGDAGSLRELPLNCEVVEGRTTVVEVDLREVQPCVVTGQLQVDGRPASGWTLSAWPGDASSFTGTLPSTALDEHGEFQLTLEDPGPVRFSFALPAQSGGSGHIDFVAELRPGANAWRESIATARIEGRSARATSDEYAIYLRQKTDGASAWIGVRTDAEGRFELPLVLAGPGRFVGVQITDGTWGTTTTLEEVQPAPGTTERVELP
jgi:RNA polymerase sigma-70 factor (ECF subfamily)